jgi:hypothetical protein
MEDSERIDALVTAPLNSPRFREAWAEHQQIVTPSRLTVVLPVVKAYDPYNDPKGHELVNAIHHREAVSTGKALLNSANGRPRPIVQLIQSKGLKRLKAGDNPVAIINDLQAQLKLVI